MRFLRLALLASLAPLTACGGSSNGNGSACQSFTPSNTESEINAALGQAKDGACFSFAAGTYKMNNQLTLGTANGVTMSGAGIGQTIFDFSGQVTAEDAIFAQSVMNLTFKGFTVKDAPGNGTRMLSVTGLTFDTVEVTWTPGSPGGDGPYGLYPVQCSNVLIQNCQVSGASDSGVYVGQSQNIVVRNNEVSLNVAGIEIENSYSADVYGNTAHDNTAGILVFALPQLQQEGGHSVRVYNNTVTNNNTKNFASNGDIVHIVPAGTGSFVMACDHVEVFGNTYSGNNTAATAVISYLDSQLPISDAKYYPYSTNVYFHDNTFMNNGTAPDTTAQFGLLIATAQQAFPGMRVADSIYDGVTDTAKGTGANPMQICFNETAANAVCDLNLPQLNAADSNLAQILTCATPTATPLNCTLPALPAVSFPGLGESDGGVGNDGGS
jgi:parallel beta-helix repeat protein